MPELKDTPPIKLSREKVRPGENINLQIPTFESLSLREQKEVTTKAKFTMQESLQKYKEIPDDQLDEITSKQFQKIKPVVDKVFSEINTRNLSDNDQEVIKSAKNYWSNNKNRPLPELTPEQKRQFCSFVDCLSEIVRTYEESGFLNEFNKDTTPLSNPNLADELIEITIKQKREFLIQCCLASVRLIQPGDSNKYLGLSFINSFLTNEFYQKHFWEIEPLQKRKTEIKKEGFEKRPKLKGVFDSIAKIMLPSSIFSHLNNIVFNETQPPPKTDKEGKTWEVAGRWDSENQTYTLFPKGSEYSPYDTNHYLTLSTTLHELGGHYFDSLFLEKNKVKIPPWIKIRVLKELRNYDPVIKPESPYVSKVIEDITLGNTDDRQKKYIPWCEQFAVMMQKFRINPKQFALDHNQELVKAFSIYCFSEEGANIPNIFDRATAWNLITRFNNLLKIPIPKLTNLVERIMSPESGKKDSFKEDKKAFKRFLSEKTSMFDLGKMSEEDMQSGAVLLLLLVASARKKVSRENIKILVAEKDLRGIDPKRKFIYLYEPPFSYLHTCLELNDQKAVGFFQFEYPEENGILKAYLVVRK